MKLLKKKIPLVSQEPEPVEPPKKERKSAKPENNKLPSDKYKPLLDTNNMAMILDERRKIVFQVIRAGKYGLPTVDMRTYLTTDTYTGYTQSGITIPLEFLPSLLETMTFIDGECKKHGIYKDCPAPDDIVGDEQEGLDEV